MSTTPASDGGDSIASNPIVLMGPVGATWLEEVASHWRTLGREVLVVVRRHYVKAFADGTPVISSYEHESRLLRAALGLLGFCLKMIERLVIALSRRRYDRARGDDLAEGDMPYSFVKPIVDGISAARHARRLEPRFVFGQHVFFFGFGAACCFGFPRVLMVFGDDIYRYAESSWLSFAMMRWILHRADMITLGSRVLRKHIIQRFGVDEEKILVIPWGIEKTEFRRADRERRLMICERFGVDPNMQVVMNVRRFKVGWGGDEVLNAFCRLAEENEGLHFVMLGGAGVKNRVQSARERLVQEGLADRFTMFEGMIPLEDCADLMSISDVFVSMMLRRDAGSRSVVQAAAAGGTPILNDAPEYRELESQGFGALFVDPQDGDALLQALRRCVADDELRAGLAAKNQAFLAQHREEPDSHMRRLLDTIEKRSGLLVE